MKVSIIIATFNSQKTIKPCVESVLNQTYENIEIIVIDGQSSDSTLSYLDETSKNNKHLKYYSEPDNGIYDALNKGVKKSTGDIVGFVHSDDMLASPAIINKIVNAFKHESVDGVYGNLVYVKFNDPKNVVRYWIGKAFVPKLLARGWMPAHPTLFLKRSVYTSYGMFDLNFKIAADYDFILRVFSKKNLRFYYLPETITIMRVGGASNKNIKNVTIKTREDIRALRNNNRPWPLITVGLKNLSKIPQWFNKKTD